MKDALVTCLMGFVPAFCVQASASAPFLLTAQSQTSTAQPNVDADDRLKTAFDELTGKLPNTKPADWPKNDQGTWVGAGVIRKGGVIEIYPAAMMIGSIDMGPLLPVNIRVVGDLYTGNAWSTVPSENFSINDFPSAINSHIQKYLRNMNIQPNAIPGSTGLWVDLYGAGTLLEVRKYNDETLLVAINQKSVGTCQSGADVHNGLCGFLYLYKHASRSNMAD
jgi:hypothetical protein